MAVNAVGIIFSNLNNNTLSRLTTDRTVAAIPYACRYRLVDFCLSNLVNANISKINIVANYNYHSLVEHIGSGKDWDLARNSGGINLISPFQVAKSASAKMYSTHMEALISMNESIAEIKEDTVVLMDSDNVLNLNLTEVIEGHELSGAEITFVTKRVGPEHASKHPRMMISSVAGKVTDIAMSVAYTDKNPELCLGIFVMKTAYLRRMIEQAIAYGQNSMTQMILSSYKHSNFRTYCYSGYAATVSSFLDYYRCSIDLTKNPAAKEQLLFKKNAPIFTKVHNSAPTIYKEGCQVKDSLIADECVIEGTVINSVLSRGVVVAKGAVVKNSVLFYGTYVGRNASLNCIVADKNVHIGDDVVLSGNDNMPFYVQKGRKV